MRVASIISEYNPFHNGHLYQIKQIKERLNIDNIMCIMSGNFVQRGQPAILDKYTRARLAVENGANLVIELPVYFSIQSAENFAKGAISILDKTKIVDYLIFGTESNIDDIIELETFIDKNKDEYEELISSYMDQGNSYIKSFYLALSTMGYKVQLGSNDILALEYIKHLKKTDMRPYGIKRLGADHLSYEKDAEFVSASYIRNKVENKHFEAIKIYVPSNSYISLVNKPEKNDSYYFDFLKYKVFVSQDEFSNILKYENGMENLIINNLKSSSSIKELISLSTSKRYSSSRISRFILTYLLNMEEIKKESYMDLYARPLAFDNKGSQILGKIKETSQIPIVSKFSDYYNSAPNKLLDYELSASNLYNINDKNKINQDFYQSPIFIDK